ncbi:hypothetical protein D3C78_1160990 [compost metagenome]
MISEGGEKIDTSGWNSGIRIKAINAKEPDPIQRKDLMNFLASETFPRPIHWPTTVTIVSDSALAGI